MISTIQNQAALLVHRERLDTALRNATVRKPTRRFPRMQRSPLLRLA